MSLNIADDHQKADISQFEPFVVDTTDTSPPPTPPVDAFDPGYMSMLLEAPNFSKLSYKDALMVIALVLCVVVRD